MNSSELAGTVTRVKRDAGYLKTNKDVKGLCFFTLEQCCLEPQTGVKEGRKTICPFTLEPPSRLLCGVALAAG